MRAWVENGLLFLARDRVLGVEKMHVLDDITHMAVLTQPEHAMLVNDHVIWVPHEPGGEIDPFLDLERCQIETGREWPPKQPPVSM